MAELLIYQTCSIIIGFIIDFFVGDPHAVPHPVVAIGKLISFLDKKLRLGNDDKRDILRGVWTVLIVIAVSTAVPAFILFIMWKIHPAIYLVISSIMCAQILAARELVRECSAVEKALEEGDIEAARKAVSYVVGRDTDALDKEGICRAAVETIAENGSDGVIAPLFWMFLFGAPGGFFYKAVNTMDSMVGYNNDRYRYFGRPAAKTDDVVNYLPSRISALLMTASAGILKLFDRSYSAGRAFRIWRRDRRKHLSPNSAQTESTCAGALGIRLGGLSYYGGVAVDKPYLGDDIRAIENKDIIRAGRLMFVSEALTLLISLAILSLIILW